MRKKYNKKRASYHSPMLSGKSPLDVLNESSGSGKNQASSEDRKRAKENVVAMRSMLQKGARDEL